jgi:outer membrane protein assembly factor BamB
MRCFTLALLSFLSAAAHAQTIQWQTELPPGKLFTKLILDNGQVVAQGPDNVMRMALQSGDMIVDGDSTFPEPSSANQLVLTVSKDKQILYLPTKNGLYLYEMETMALMDVVMEDMESLLIFEDSLFCIKERKLFKYNLDQLTIPLWSSEEGGSGMKIVNVQRIGTDELLVQVAFGFVKLQESTGEMDWKFAPRGSMTTHTSSKKFMYTAEDFGRDLGSVITQVDMSTGKRVWELPIEDGVIGNMVVDGGNLLFMTVKDDHHTEVYSMDTSPRRYPGSVRGAAAVVV